MNENGIHASIVSEPLSLEATTRRVEDPAAGAIATFVGVTRDNFEGKQVFKLEYEAYEPMAVKQIKVVCAEAKRRWDVRKIAVVHRIGTVAVGELSVIIAVSAAHRRAALEACAWTIDELKATVPVWKKEFFAGGEVWKENAESRLAQYKQKTNPQP